MDRYSKQHQKFVHARNHIYEHPTIANDKCQEKGEAFLSSISLCIQPNRKSKCQTVKGECANSNA